MPEGCSSVLTQLVVAGGAPGRSSLLRRRPRRGSGWSCARASDRPAAAAAAVRRRARARLMRAALTAHGCRSRSASAPPPDRCPVCTPRCPRAASPSPAQNLDHKNPRLSTHTWLGSHIEALWQAIVQAQGVSNLSKHIRSCCQQCGGTCRPTPPRTCLLALLMHSAGIFTCRHKRDSITESRKRSPDALEITLEHPKARQSTPLDLGRDSPPHTSLPRRQGILRDP
jgi:hypothetical protein